MAKKKKSKSYQPVEQPSDVSIQQPEQTVVQFEIGKKGDEFDLAYTKALREKTADTDRLLYNLSRESAADKFNFTDVILPFIVLFFASLTFIAVSRGDIDELLTVSFNKDTLADGSYTAMLDEVYTETLPFGDNIKYVGSLLGFGYVEKDADVLPDDTEEGPPEEEEELPEVPQVTEPPVTTTEEVTTLPETVTTPETTTEYIPPETYVMYASATVNIRLEASSNGVILGYFVVNEPVDVIEIESSGWARILYNGMEAYVYAEYLSEELTVTTVKTTTAATTVTTTEEVTEEITTVPDADLTVSDESEEILEEDGSQNDLL